MKKFLQVITFFGMADVQLARADVEKTIIAGLTFGTVLTMILVPVLYATLYRDSVAKPSPRKLVFDSAETRRFGKRTIRQEM